MTERRYSEEVPRSLDGERIDRVVSFLVDVSRREATELVSKKAVRINGGVVTKGANKISCGSTIEVVVPEKSETLLADPTVSFEVVHEDDHLIVINKPAGLIVHPGAGVTAATLVHGLIAQYPELSEVGERQRPGLVHRLDKGTSGLLMVARTDHSYTDLVDQLRHRLVERHYQTLVVGEVDADSGVIDAPLGRSLRDATRRSVVASGRPAVTHYRVIQRFQASECCLIECKLETGRTHQIRAHVAAIGHPVVGDTKYGGSDLGLLERPFLHAATLGFTHPVTAEEMSFSQPLPADLEAAITTLKANEAKAEDDE